MFGVEITEASGVITVATVSAGTNAPNYDNIVSNYILTGLNTVGSNMLSTTLVHSAVNGNVDIYAKVQNSAVATNLKARLYMLYITHTN